MEERAIGGGWADGGDGGGSPDGRVLLDGGDGQGAQAAPEEGERAHCGGGSEGMRGGAEVEGCGDGGGRGHGVGSRLGWDWEAPRKLEQGIERRIDGSHYLRARTENDRVFSWLPDKARGLGRTTRTFGSTREPISNDVEWRGGHTHHYLIWAVLHVRSLLRTGPFANCFCIFSPIARLNFKINFYLS